MSVVDYTLSIVIIKLCERHAVKKKVLGLSLDDIRDELDVVECDCVIVLDRD